MAILLNLVKLSPICSTGTATPTVQVQLVPLLMIFSTHSTCGVLWRLSHRAESHYSAQWTQMRSFGKSLDYRTYRMAIFYIFLKKLSLWRCATISTITMVCMPAIMPAGHHIMESCNNPRAPSVERQLHTQARTQDFLKGGSKWKGK